LGRGQQPHVQRFVEELRPGSDRSDDLDDVAASFDALCGKDVKDANAALKAKGLPEITGWDRTTQEARAAP
jgi:hypothetical protein